MVIIIPHLILQCTHHIVIYMPHVEGHCHQVDTITVMLEHEILWRVALNC